ncbi:MAG: S1 RNA-binding domain-containing protein, partial [Planctomycetota bacterium]|nr:S1 RNA-binding domain-containing protein [Planctomycetota bacterium]
MTPDDSTNPALPLGSAPQPAPTPDAATRLEAEIAAAMEGFEMTTIMADAPAAAKPRVGRMAAAVAPTAQSGAMRSRRGTITHVKDRDVFVEFDAKSHGVCPSSHFTEMPEAGTTWDFIVERFDPFESLLILARPGSVLKGTAWSDLSVGMTVEARCVGMSAGGLDMEVAHSRAFMPHREIDIRHVEDASVYLGLKFACEIIELRREKGRMILSLRRVKERERAEAQIQILATLEVGQRRTATIVSLQPYGAFADIGGIDGLIPVGELAHEHIKHPSDVVKEGDVVEVRVKRIDLGQKPPRISLSRKDVMADPIRTKFEELVVGATITGRVKNFADFGAFIEVAPGVEGLVHATEITWDRVPNPMSRLKIDEVLDVKVLNVDAKARRVSLSIKALT